MKKIFIMLIAVFASILLLASDNTAKVIYTASTAAPLAQELKSQFKVNENSNYRITVALKTENPKESIEENPTLDSTLPNWLSFMTIRFKDMNGVVMPGARNRKIMPSTQSKEHIELFYAPLGAVSCEIIINPNSNSLIVESIKSEENFKTDTINLNSKFELGRSNSSFWPQRGLIEIEPGKFVFNTNYGSLSDWFPLSERGTYEIFVKGRRYGSYNETILRIYDQTGKRISEVKALASPEGTRKYFVLPAGAVRGEFLIYDTLLEECSLRRIGNEDKIKDLTK